MYYQSWVVDLLWCVMSIVSQADKWNNSHRIYSFNRTVNSFMVSAFKSCFIFKGVCASSLRFAMFRKCLPQDPLHFLFLHCILENVYSFFFFLKCKRRTREQWSFKSQSCYRKTQRQEQIAMISEIKPDFGWNENFDHEWKKREGWETGTFLAEPGVRATRGRQNAWAGLRLSKTPVSYAVFNLSHHCQFMNTTLAHF